MPGRQLNIPAPPSLSASWYSISKLSPFFMPRPPDTTTRADARSGLAHQQSTCEQGSGDATWLFRHAPVRHDFLLRHEGRQACQRKQPVSTARADCRVVALVPASGSSGSGASDTVAEPPSAAALSKAVVRTVITWVNQTAGQPPRTMEQIKGRRTLTASLDVTVTMAFPAYVGRSNCDSLSTAVTSESGATSSLTPTRGMKFLPLFVAGAMMCVYAASTRAVMVSGRAQAPQHPHNVQLAAWHARTRSVTFSATPCSYA